MDENKKIDLIFEAADEIRYIRSQADQKIEEVHRGLIRRFEEEGLSTQEAYYELYLLGARVNADALEA